MSGVALPAVAYPPRTLAKDYAIHLVHGLAVAGAYAALEGMRRRRRFRFNGGVGGRTAKRFSMDGKRVQNSSHRARATLARSRAANLCREAQSLRKSSESVTAAILSHLHASAFPGNLDPQRLVLRLVPLAPCVSFARRELGLWLARNGVERALARDISVACSEACANAVEHPVSPARHLFEVWGEVGADTVAIEVRDYGDWAVRPPDDSERGRGLALMRALMDRVEVEREGAGTSVTMWKRRSPVQQQSPSTTTST